MQRCLKATDQEVAELTQKESELKAAVDVRLDASEGAGESAATAKS